MKRKKKVIGWPIFACFLGFCPVLFADKRDVGIPRRGLPSRYARQLRRAERGDFASLFCFLFREWHALVHSHRTEEAPHVQLKRSHVPLLQSALCRSAARCTLCKYTHALRLRFDSPRSNNSRVSATGHGRLRTGNDNVVVGLGDKL